ncbi:hypothetical protein C1Y63_00980 [Corynebacterium sp. 13CS0277]|uniref:hypothetical protein n=1 Tax=Corynebacterium sp. 13CS0277 TaxID=2071994 RepID=UPI000D029959|nr:hypothetical protein [Corynebacterium sp. 13CS0277]PRQ12398.1 hypothetical protein C1Y63_00980 [Corynebacterium sp. 13CS0277]
MKTRLASALAVCACATLAACSPPHEIDSEKWVDTATGVAAPTVAPTSAAATTVAAADALPGYTNCVGSPEQRPDEISLACGDNNDVLRDITWTEWTATNATGTATRVTNDCTPNCADGKLQKTEDVKVVLSNPYDTVSGASFTQVAVDGVVILP